MKNCTSEVIDELHEYYIVRNKLIGDFAKFAQCIDDEDLFIQGDPFAWNDHASIGIIFTPCQNDTDKNYTCRT